MKKKFKLDEGDYWDGDEEIIHWLKDKLVKAGEVGDFPQIKSDFEVLIEIRKK